MAKVIVFYESKYGNTRVVAEKIIEGLRKVEETQAVLSELKEVDLDKIFDYDASLICSPNQFGGPTRSVKKFLERLGKLPLKGEIVCCF